MYKVTADTGSDIFIFIIHIFCIRERVILEIILEREVLGSKDKYFKRE